ncbi:MAG TPA: serpin family protein [Anaerolineales bacterium]
MKRLILAIILASFLVACGQAPILTATQLSSPTEGPAQTSEPMPDSQMVRADVPRVASPEVSQEHLEELVQGNTIFAFDLYRRVTQGSSDNLIYSPYSISLAFSMVYAGAAGETQAQMTKVLNYLAQEAQHPAFNALDHHLASLGDERGGETEGEPFQLNIANAVWGQQGLPIKEPYLNTLAGQYGAGLRVVDFAQDPEGARQRVNDWVAEKTEERISDILPVGAIDAATRLVLANAIYFNAGWLFPFDPAATQEQPFNLLDGAQISVPMMHLNTVRAPYYQGNGYQAILLPYTGEKVDMLVILPERGQFETVQEGMSVDLLDQVRAQAEIHDVTLSMPKFDFETDVNLPDLFKEMGMTAPFSSGAADFSGIVEDGGLYISAAVHKGMIKVDELGTEAAAATVIGMAESAMPSAEMTLDRPFIFAILERETGTILFLGRVMDPMG